MGRFRVFTLHKVGSPGGFEQRKNRIWTLGFTTITLAAGCKMETEGGQGKSRDPQRSCLMIQVREDGSWTGVVAKQGGTCFKHSRQDSFFSLLVSYPIGAS